MTYKRQKNNYTTGFQDIRKTEVNNEKVLLSVLSNYESSMYRNRNVTNLSNKGGNIKK